MRTVLVRSLERNVGRRTPWLTALVVAGIASVATAQQDPYTPIPSGFDFPADQAVLEKLRSAVRVDEQRVHVWKVWAGMNQNAAHGGPVWETWYSTDEVFSVSGPAEAAQRVLKRKFERPRQIKPLEAAGQSLFSFVLMNQSGRNHIRSNKYYLQATLTSLNSGFPAATPLPDRKIADFPGDSVSIKTVWQPVKQTGLTDLPIWDLQPTKPLNQSNDPSTWKRHVAVDPSRITVPPGEMNMGRHVVPASSFYSVKLTASDIMNPNLPAGMQAGDLMVLVGMHVTTKEIPDWVWATFWWHDRPDDGPFAQNRVAEVPGVFRNYLMNISYDTNEPREFDGSPHSCMNPWLEARFVNGLASNCMTCHQRSTWPQTSFLPVTRGGLEPNDSFFKDRTKLDFLWSIGDLAQ